MQFTLSCLSNDHLISKTIHHKLFLEIGNIKYFLNLKKTDSNEEIQRSTKFIFNIATIRQTAI